MTKYNGKILIVLLIGAVINGGFYTFQRIFYDQKTIAALNITFSGKVGSENREWLSNPSVVFYLENSPEHKFIPPKEILNSWVEEYYRSSTRQREKRLSSEKIFSYLGAIKSEVEKKPINARLEFSENKVSAFSLPQNGLELDMEKSINKIFKEFRNKNFEIALETKVVEPEITLDKIENLGITALLARGESDFSGSSKSRIHNINVGSAVFNGALLKPGEEFSFNSLLGTVDQERGYQYELVIKSGKLIPEYGGGICQISTTVFRAAILAGLPISERRSHSLPVRYYNPQGFDATVYPGVVDLKFKNDTAGHVLIQIKVEKSSLLVEIYGSPDSRKVEVSDPIQYDIKSNGSLKAVFTRTVTTPDGAKKEDTFYSNYKSPSLFPLEKNPLE